MTELPDKFALPRVPFSDVLPLWFDGFWDGPLSGVCEVRGEPHWFSLPVEDRGWRRYALHPLTPEQFDVLRRRQAVFAQRVGPHTYLTPKWRRAGRFTAPEGWHDFYELSDDERGGDNSFVKDLPIVGWFSRTPHRARPRSCRYWAKRQPSFPCTEGPDQ